MGSQQLPEEGRPAQGDFNNVCINPKPVGGPIAADSGEPAAGLGLDCLQSYAQLFHKALREAQVAASGAQQVHIVLRLHEPTPCTGSVSLAWSAEPVRLTIPDTYTAGDVMTLASVHAGGTLVVQALYRKPIQKELDEQATELPVQGDCKVRMRDSDMMSTLLAMASSLGVPTLGKATNPLELWLAVQPHGTGVLRTACGYVLRSSNAGMRTSGVRGSKTVMRIPSSAMASPTGKRGTTTTTTVSHLAVPSPLRTKRSSTAPDYQPHKRNASLAAQSDMTDSEATQDEEVSVEDVPGQQHPAPGEVSGQPSQPAPSGDYSGPPQQPVADQPTDNPAPQPSASEQQQQRCPVVAGGDAGVPMSLGPFTAAEADLDVLLQPGGLTESNLDAALAAIMAIAAGQLGGGAAVPGGGGGALPDAAVGSQLESAVSLPGSGGGAAPPQAAAPRTAPPSKPAGNTADDSAHVMVHESAVLADTAAAGPGNGNSSNSNGDNNPNRRSMRQNDGSVKRLKKFHEALRNEVPGVDDEGDRDYVRQAHGGRGNRNGVRAGVVRAGHEDDDEANEVAQTLMSVREGRHPARLPGERRARVKYSEEEIHALLDGLLALKESHRETAWATIKRASGLVLSKRSNVDLKDKWRNLQLQWYKSELPADMAAKVMRAKAKTDHPGPWPEDTQW